MMECSFKALAKLFLMKLYIFGGLCPFQCNLGSRVITFLCNLGVSSN